MAVVYDASALLAVVFNEPGADAVLAHLVQPGGAVSAVNWAEIASKLIDHGMSGAEVKRELAHFTLDVTPLDEATALAAGTLRSSTRALGLSLGDRCCLALALQLGGATVVTADKAWKALKGFKIALVR